MRRPFTIDTTALWFAGRNVEPRKGTPVGHAGQLAARLAVERGAQAAAFAAMRASRADRIARAVAERVRLIAKTQSRERRDAKRRGPRGGCPPAAAQPSAGTTTSEATS